MARYIKVNYKVAQYLRLENDRNKVKDGNYLLWQADITPFGKLTELAAILARIGGLALLAHEARQEQDGTVIRELPTATDPQFVIETATEETTEGEIGTGATATDTETTTEETTTEEVATEETTTEEATTEETTTEEVAATEETTNEEETEA